jgi:hypothetical protein
MFVAMLGLGVFVHFADSLTEQQADRHSYRSFSQFLYIKDDILKPLALRERKRRLAGREEDGGFCHFWRSSYTPSPSL